MRWIRCVLPECQPQRKDERRCAHYAGHHIPCRPPAAIYLHRAQVSGSCSYTFAAGITPKGSLKPSKPYLLSTAENLSQFPC